MPRRELPAGDPANRRPKIAISSWSLHKRITRGELAIAAFPQFVKSTFGLDRIEVLKNHLMSGDDEELHRVAEAAAAAGTSIVCLALDNDFTVDEPELELECRRAADMLRRARVLGAHVARVNPGMGGEGSDEELAKRVATGLRRLVPTAEETGMVLALENQQLFGIKPENILRVMDAVRDCEQVGVCLDFGGFFSEDLETAPALLAPYAVHVHAKSYEFTPDGKRETSIDYPRRLKELSEANYSGCISIEWEGDDRLDDVANIWRTINLIRWNLSQWGQRQDSPEPPY